MQERIIHFLKSAEGYISGEEMSDQLNISRAAVWKYIDQLRQDGYDIAAVPHLGYKLDGVPDKLLPNEIQFNLKAKIMGRRIEAFDTLSSTMDEAFRLGMEGAPEGTVVCAESQTKGRGRLGRSWVSPSGKGIYCSIILRPKFSLSQMAQLTLMTAVALSQAIEEGAGIKPSIKWPNDILYRDRKLAGILTEMRAEMDQVKFIVIGIGLNVNTAASYLVPEATSLKIETGKVIHRVRMLQAILERMEFWYLQLNAGSFDAMLKEWKARSATLKKRVSISDAAGTVQGMAFDLDSDGGLMIRQDSGVVIKKMAGDVLPVKA